MCAQASSKTLVCRDCGYELTIRSHGEDEVSSHFCERCGGQHIDIECNSEHIRQKSVQFLKDLLHIKIF